MPEVELYGADSVGAGDLPIDREWYAGYIDGQWPSYHAIRSRFPARPVKAITCSTSTPVDLAVLADVIDIETGDYTADRASVVAATKLTRGYGTPTLYFQASRLAEVNTALSKVALFPISRTGPVLAFVASWGIGPTVPDYAVALQYANHPGWDDDVALSSWVLTGGGEAPKVSAGVLAAPIIARRS